MCMHSLFLFYLNENKTKNQKPKTNNNDIIVQLTKTRNFIEAKQQFPQGMHIA